MAELLTQCHDLIWALWVVSSVACSLLLATWRLSLTRRYLFEALGREQRLRIAQMRSMANEHCRSYSELQRSLLQSFLQEPTPTLNDLVESREHEFRARASERPSAPPRPLTGALDETIELTTRDFTPQSQGSRVTPRGNRFDR